MRRFLVFVLALGAVACATQLGAHGAPAPAAPVNVSAAPGACGFEKGINVFWSPFTFTSGQLHHYNVYRDGAIFGQSNTTVFHDASRPGDYHAYTVSAVDAQGHETARSGHASAIVLDCTRTPPRVGALRVAVFIVNKISMTKASAAHAVFDLASAKYRTASWGQAWLTGDVFGPYQLSGLSVPCDMNGIVSDVRKAAGITHNEYDYFLVFGSRCGSIGQPEQGALTDKKEHAAHELGHELGMYHASSTRCTVAVLNAGTCKQLNDYGNRYDFMGGNDELNAPHKDSLSWLNFDGRSQITEVTQSSTFELAPLDVAPTASDTALRALKIVTGPTTVPASAKPKYVYLEYRAGQKGLFAIQDSPVVAGFHGFPSSGRNYLLPYKGHPLFTPGAKLQFLRDNKTVTVDVVSITNNRAIVKVTIG